MWIFVYGSLMWDYNDIKEYILSMKKATLVGFHRDFNKKSTRNWGTKENPAPTLGLKRGGYCIGIAFEFEDNDQEEVFNILNEREGRHFTYPQKEIQVEGNGEIEAFLPYNKRDKSFIGKKSIKRRVEMCLMARGTNGNGVEYIRNTRTKLIELKIVDNDVETFWSLLEKHQKD